MVSPEASVDPDAVAVSVSPTSIWVGEKVISVGVEGATLFTVT